MNAQTIFTRAPDTATPQGTSLTVPILLGWMVAALVLTLVQASAIAAMRFPDPDDATRYLEVRDWLAGQSWWDVSQHRLWDGHFAMHWSRLVDLPLAAVMACFDPLVGQVWSNRIAMTAVPLATLLCLVALAATLTRRLAGSEAARLAILLAPLSVPLIYQIRPMRIDHHGWQIVLALGATSAVLSRPTWRSGALAGIALALLLTISLEGLPITAAIVGVAALAWAVDPTRRAQLAALVATLLATVIALHAATRGPAMFAPACDAIAPVWIAALGVATLGVLAALTVAQRAAPAIRIALLALSGTAALLVLRLVAPACVAGPFATLDPLVYHFWYDNVSEGLPIWEQGPAWALMTISLPILGLIGGVLAWRAADGQDRHRWTMLLALGGLALALALLVMRTGATANALALPGAAWLLDRLLRRARAVSRVLPRIAAIAGAYAAVTPGLLGSALFGLGGPATAATNTSPSQFARASCDHGREVVVYARLPAATLFAPLDVTPSLLARTPHRAIASGYHRNGAAMRLVLATFMAAPETARRNVLATGADYVVGCPGENETEIYKRAAPNGLWARLERGERFDWLQPIDLHSPALAWRVVRPLPTAPTRP